MDRLLAAAPQTSSTPRPRQLRHRPGLQHRGPPRENPGIGGGEVDALSTRVKRPTVAGAGRRTRADDIESLTPIARVCSPLARRAGTSER
jgi:hypothetical protein